MSESGSRTAAGHRSPRRQSSPRALATGARFTLTQVATPNFDHAIVYVPQIDVYLDPTSSLMSFGALPVPLYGKPVLNIGRGVVSSIPVEGPEDFLLRTETEYALQPDGTRKAKSILSGTFAITAPFEITKAIDLGDRPSIRMLPLTDPRPSLFQLSSAGTGERDFRCVSLDYRELASLSLPKGSNIYENPAPLSYVRSFSGDTAYGPVTGRAEVSRNVVIDGAAVQSEGHVRLAFSAPICPKAFSDEIKGALAKFHEFQRVPISITPQPVTHVVEIGSDYAKERAAYWSGDTLWR
jgi:hypothetical protein